VTATESGPLSHGRAFELLPWLVNGTLAGSEREAVEEHARTCIVCRRELKEQQRLYAGVRARRTADVSAEAGFEALDDQLDAATTRWRVRYATAAPFAIAAAAGLAVLAVLVWFTPLPEIDAKVYSTLATSSASDSVLLDIVFAEDTTSAEMQQLLDGIGGEIVAGPSNVGRYTVRVPEPGDDARLRDLLDVLTADSRVRFAGPTLTEIAP
jgi:hypothetical protein